ncbi:bacteriochlorophyll 4-vinyl reductase [Paragemmobacter straminiformis]|uniref:Bacteriochlorophyll 4-vinyl reductase n=1 Tax=Paragemmobacter straminiformis TaxID=2045119 RepID=A0A842I999_9RHOB|nr:bacteriochlorophyll 4-vinyl reductase [Gemmobacter straminiformis]MBC2836622.1 bacteriochlorophyll 4-vinyl reductase [Gemmobacter straminiformis]
MNAAAHQGARIGPNAVLQLMAVLDRAEGRIVRDRVLAGLRLPAPDSGMIPEAEAIAAHRAVRAALPDRADGLLVAAGEATADYILRHRIPAPAKLVIRLLPGALGARLLARAIERHAWTFAGSGRFRVAGFAPLTFELVHNPLVTQGKTCLWHAAVFRRLFAALVWRGCRVEEVACAGLGAGHCRFLILPQ